MNLLQLLGVAAPDATQAPQGRQTLPAPLGSQVPPQAALMSRESLPARDFAGTIQEGDITEAGDVRSGIMRLAKAPPQISPRAQAFLDDVLRQSKEAFPTFRHASPQRHFADESIKRLGPSITQEDLGQIASGLMRAGADAELTKTFIKHLGRQAARRTRESGTQDLFKGPRPREGGPDISSDFFSNL